MGFERAPFGGMVLPPLLSRIFNPRLRSLIRANTLVLVSFIAAIFLSDFPHNRRNPLLAIPLAVGAAGLADTIRCMQKRWNFYHGGVLLCIYMDLMALAMIAFFLIYPYFLFLINTH